MTISIGSAQLVGTQVQLVAPPGFNLVQAVRLANYTNYAMILTNLGNSVNQEALQTVQQNVYKYQNVSTPGIVASANPYDANLNPTGVTNAQLVAALQGGAVEFSDDPDEDFAGTGLSANTYPCPISVPSQIVANAIFATGVPTVLLQDQVYNAVVPGGGVSIPVTKYASVQLLAVFAGAGVLQVDQLSAAGLVLNTQYLTMDANSLTFTSNMEMPLRGTTLRLQTVQGSAPTVTVLASNRTLARTDAANGSSVPQVWGLGSATYTAGQQGVLNMNSTPGSAQRLTGRCRATFIVGGTVLKGEFLLEYNSGNGFVTQQIADTSQPEAHTSGTQQIIYTEVTLPVIDYQLGFIARVAGTGLLSAYLSPDNP